MKPDRPHHRSLQPIRSVLVRTQESQRIGPVFNPRLHIDFRDNPLLAARSQWRGRTSLVNRSTVRVGHELPPAVSLLDLVDIRGLDEVGSRFPTLIELVDLQPAAPSLRRASRKPSSPPSLHQEYDILLSEWASVTAAQAPWRPCTFPTFESEIPERQIDDLLKTAGLKSSLEMRLGVHDQLGRIQQQIDKVLQFWKAVITRRDKPINLLLTEAYLLHCGFPAYPLAISADGVLEILVLFPSRDVLVHNFAVVPDSARFRPKLILTERTEAQKNAEYSRELVRFLTAIARAGLSASPSANSARLLVIREEDLGEWRTADLCAEFTLTADRARDLDGNDSQWVNTWVNIVEYLNAYDFVDGRHFDEFVTDFGESLLDVDAKILEAFGRNTSAVITADGGLEKIGTLASAISSVPDLQLALTDSFPLTSDLCSTAFWWDLNARALEYQSQVQARAKPPQQPPPQKVHGVRQPNRPSAPRPNPRPILPTQSKEP